MIEINLLSKLIYSPKQLQNPPEFTFPGFADLVIAFFTIFVVIMQQNAMSEVFNTIPQLNGLLFIYSITFSVSTLYIAWRSSQLSTIMKNKMQYKVIFPSFVSIAIIFIFLIIYLIPTWSQLLQETSLLDKCDSPTRAQCDIVRDEETKFSGDCYTSGANQWLKITLFEICPLEKGKSMAVGRDLLIVIFIPNTILLFFHTWLWLASVDYHGKGLKNVSFVDFVLLAPPYSSCLINILLIFSFF